MLMHAYAFSIMSITPAETHFVDPKAETEVFNVLNSYKQLKQHNYGPVIPVIGVAACGYK